VQASIPKHLAVAVAENKTFLFLQGKNENRIEE